MPVKPAAGSGETCHSIRLSEGRHRFPVSSRSASGGKFAAHAGLSRQGVGRGGVAACECLHGGARVVLANAAARNALRYDETLSPDCRATTREGRT